MKSAIKLFLVLITITAVVIAWLTKQLGNPRIQLMIVILLGVGIAAFFSMNLIDHRIHRKRRTEKESRAENQSRNVHKSLSDGMDQKSPDSNFALRERKSGLTWGGGNIKASEAKRGTKRKFLGK